MPESVLKAVPVGTYEVVNDFLLLRGHLVVLALSAREKTGVFS
jgi:hypothetical protein